MKKILFIISLAVVLTPVLALAAIPGVTPGTPLVPCDILGAGPGAPCRFCDFFTLISNISTFLLVLIIPLAGIAIVVGGVYMVVSGGREGLRSRGKQIVWIAIWGLILAFGSWLIVNVILLALTKTPMPSPWWSPPGFC